MNSIYIKEKLQKLEKEHLIREERIFESPQLAQSMIDSKEYLLFSSSNYLSLGENKEILEKVKKRMDSIGLGSGGSRLTTGSHKVHKDLERNLAEFIGYENSLVYSSGFMANLGFLTSVCDDETIVFSDEKNHASIIDGIRLSKSKVEVYKHLDFKDLEEKLKKYPNRNKVLVSDGVFSMDGDILPLDEFCRLGEKYKALTYVDDAHGFGILGENGKGITEIYKTYPDVMLVTFSKALGASGAALLTSNLMRKYLYNTSREFIFSTSISPVDTLIILESLNYIKSNKKNINKLKDNVSYLKKKLEENNFDIGGNSHIIPIKVGNEKRAQEIFKKLMDSGIFLSIIRFPAVPKNEAILRVTPMANHSKEDLDFLLKKLKEFVK
ncbi:pyridoxal phosphate-dependent aminotransferase family protein [Peptoniphilus harei]|uniref:8-amino-7-oxononanoate synthase n=1 Tax=Peptoniphilus harei TaxID=54005 RepID=A0A2X1XX46_9FIRM|nr:pyridoxal phosphate-dependent aminotransferase family protein [Peptoniphilus harei]QQT90622.1 pyridoxal phosphate-dependent aminotransferase family protein [Peptoniphilus harei]SPY48108.1 8-amino-7-oxononanoate synthase [Peptoniphilus harei]